jgi:tetratricopeptide (TPR) repeat protein
MPAVGYYRFVTGQLDKAAQTYHEEIESYPRESEAYGDLGAVLVSQGQYEKAAEITRQGMRLAPDDVGMYGNLANYTLGLQRFDQTRSIIVEAQGQKWMIIHSMKVSMPLPSSGRTRRRWWRSNSGSRVSPNMRTLGLRI